MMVVNFLCLLSAKVIKELSFLGKEDDIEDKQYLLMQTSGEFIVSVSKLGHIVRAYMRTLPVILTMQYFF